MVTRVVAAIQVRLAVVLEVAERLARVGHPAARFPT
jgi:hypothetical protein